ncbi:uncharacterized small protein (DUF1192 family) [Pseudomonas migulae]|uniref:hypothetical protein n=1 Tax=Pseudomonas migulae TaxID=78543 RepID=UPI00209D0DE5|nr:hypothetical protein [Pseudomonas migulae]MCP1521231.1 uncharacterized small protein (DUF1192 family) [Pseudomonas migulae]
MSRSLWTRFKLQIAFVVAGSLLLTGCANTGSSMLGGSEGADPRLTQGNDAEFFSKSGYQACAVGAGVGILGCALSNSSNKAVCAIAAGITACGVAMGANYYLDQRRSEYADTSTRLAKMNSEVEQDTRNVIARTETAQQVIKDDQARIAKIKQDIASKKVDKNKAQTQIAEIDNNIAILRKDLSNMRNKVTEYSKVADAERAQGSSAEMKKVDVSILKMNEKVAALQKEVDGLYSQRSAITLG